MYVPIHDIDEIHKRITHLVPIHHREQCRRRRLNGLKTRAARPEQRGAEDEEADVDGHGAHQDREGVAEPCEGEGGTFSVEVGRSVWVIGNGARLQCEDTFLVFMFSSFTFSFNDFLCVFILRVSTKASSLTLFECDHQRVVLRTELRKP